jgi:hypothetical protein
LPGNRFHEKKKKKRKKKRFISTLLKVPIADSAVGIELCPGVASTLLKKKERNV